MPCSHSWAQCSADPKQNKAVCSTMSNQPTSLPVMAFLWTASSPIADTDFCKPMVEHELDRRIRSRLGSTLKGPCATEIQAHSREIGEPCLQQGQRTCQEPEHLSPDAQIIGANGNARGCPLCPGKTTVEMTRSEVSPRGAGCEATGLMSHAELGLSRQKVAHLEAMPSFLGILYREILGRQVLGDCASAMLHGRVLPYCKTHDHPSRTYT